MNESIIQRPVRGHRDIEVIEEVFDYEGYEVVRGEFFAHTYEPMVSFYQSKVAVNSACLRKFENTEYIQFLMNEEKKKLAIRPSVEEDKDSYKWSAGKRKRIPRQIKCLPFFAHVFSLMGWNPAYKYRLLGKLIHSHNEYLFVFDMNSPEIFVSRSDIESGKVKLSRTATYPEEWKHQFGIPAKTYQNAVRIETFDEFTVFGVTSTNYPYMAERAVTNNE